jgi:T5SS/PEP-CTERM-associated repeat protein
MSPRSRFSFLVFTLFLAAALLAGSFWLARAAQVLPWSFKPVTSALPPGTQLGFVREVGEQGELVVEYYTQTAETGITNHGIAFGGTLTPIISEGQPAPGGGTFRETSNLFFAYAASPTLVYFTTDIDLGGETPIRAYRWNSGTLTHLPTQANEMYLVNINDAHGKFILRRTVSAADTEYRITDGVTFSDPITLHTDNINDNPRTTQQLVGITADGGFLIYETISSEEATCSFAPPVSLAQPTGTGVTRLFWLGSRSGDVVIGSSSGGTCSGSGMNIETTVVNSAGDILTQEYTFAYNYNIPGFKGTQLFTLRLYPGNGSASSMVAQGQHVDDVGPYFFPTPKAITEARQPIFSASAGRNGIEKLYTGPNPTTDQFDGDFFNGFGQDGEALTLYHASEKGFVIVLAQLDDDTYADTIGSAAGVNSWIDPAGGNWGDPANWSSNEVPGSTSETLFNLDADYTVNVGTHDVGRVRIEDGFVTFENANLTLLGPLTLGNDATFELISGKLKTDNLVIGSLSPADILIPPIAHVQISNPGTVLSATAVISISHASPGSLFLDDARIDSGSVVIGETFPGSAALSGQDANWYSTGSTAVGYNYTGTLSIENGAFMRSAGEVVIGQGNSLQEYTSLVQVRNFATPLNSIGTNWLLLDTLTIGNFLRGELDISHGGRVTLFGNNSILQAGLRAHPAPGFDAFISVDGSADSAVVTSTLEAFNDVLLGMADGASVGVNVNGGGQFIVDSADLFLGFIPGSEAVMTVAGINPHGAPALVQVKRPAPLDFSRGVCAIGEGGTGRLLIHSGGQVDCGTIRIGGQPGSSGFVQVNGANGASTLTTEGGLCIGGDFLGLCGAAESGSQGTLELKNSASVSAGRGTLVGPGGKIMGSGDLFVGVLGLDVAEGGAVDPGVTVLAPENVSPFAAATNETGTLAISGNVTISPTAEVKLDILGLSNHDQLIIQGNLNLAGGTLTLAFGNGYLPQEGAAFELLTAASTAGEFDDVAITGLPAGYVFSVKLVNGKLVAEVTEAPAATFKIFLPLVVRGGGDG